MSGNDGLVDISEVLEARETIRDVVTNTPCLPSRVYSRELGVDAFFKYETLQLTGSFKVRGALNRVRSLSAAEREHGVVAASAGNHAQGVAFAAAQAGIPATIVMPVTTPLLKIENTERLGGHVVLAGETFDEANEEALRLCAERGSTFVPPFENRQVIAGQGTIGLEILEQTPEVQAVIVPIGGGGLISGIAVAIKERRPDVAVYGVQTEAAPAMVDSFRAGRIVAGKAERSVADGIAVKHPGDLTFAHIRRYVDGVEAVSEEQIRSAMISLLEVGKTVTEGAAATALAAVRAQCFPHLAGRKVVMVLSGANVDVSLLSRIIDRSLVEHHRLVRFKTHVTDRPGSLADLLKIVASAGGNVVRIQHDRVFKQAGFWEAQVELTLETRNSAHIAAVQERLSAEGYEAERLD